MGTMDATTRKRENGETVIDLDLGTGTIFVLTRDEAAKLMRKLNLCISDSMSTSEHFWLILAGSPGVVIDTELNDFETLKRNCNAYARMHRAGVWAVAMDRNVGMTGILAWPRVGDVAE